MICKSTSGSRQFSSHWFLRFFHLSTDRLFIRPLNLHIYLPAVSYVMWTGVNTDIQFTTNIHSQTHSQGLAAAAWHVYKSPAPPHLDAHHRTLRITTCLSFALVCPLLHKTQNTGLHHRTTAFGRCSPRKVYSNITRRKRTDVALKSR